jgi:hypothetical protein
MAFEIMVNPGIFEQLKKLAADFNRDDFRISEFDAKPLLRN